MAKKRATKGSDCLFHSLDIIHLLADIRKDMAEGFQQIHERLDEREEADLDAIDDHTPPDWPACEHESFHDIATRGDEPIWFCEDCQTIIDEEELDG